MKPMSAERLTEIAANNADPANTPVGQLLTEIDRLRSERTAFLALLDAVVEYFNSGRTERSRGALISEMHKCGTLDGN